MTRVTVVIPAHNRIDFLAEAVRSVAAQTLQDLQLVVIDDRSDPPVRQAVEEAWCETRDASDLQVIEQVEGHGNTARNKGIEATQGDMIQFMDSDDLLHQRKLEVQSRELESDATLDFVTSYEQFFYEQPGDCGRVWNIDFHEQTLSDLERFFNHDSVWNTGAPLWRTSFVRSIGGWAPELRCWQDWEFHSRALIAGANHHRTPHVLYFRREHDQEVCVSSLTRLERERNVLRAVQLVFSQLECSESSVDGTWLRCLLETYLLRRQERLANLGEGGTQLRRDASLTAQLICPSRRRQWMYPLLVRLAGTTWWNTAAKIISNQCSSLPNSQTYKKVIVPRNMPATEIVSEKKQRSIPVE